MGGESLLAFSVLLLWCAVANVVGFTAPARCFSPTRKGLSVYANAKPSSSGPSHNVTVSYEGLSCDIQVRPGETILDALERNRVGDTLSLPQMPSDCRRGNCMTCTAMCGNSTGQLLLRGEDGLSSEVSKIVADSGHVLTCCSYVQGDGLKLELGENHRVWDTIYRQRFESEETQLIARAAMARVIRKNAERNVEEWATGVEAGLRKSGDDHST
jgi:ferredoxin